VETKKRRLIIGLLLVIVMLALFYFAGLFQGVTAKIQGPGGFVEPKVNLARLYPGIDH
jgi:hypothetical protein